MAVDGSTGGILMLILLADHPSTTLMQPPCQVSTNSRQLPVYLHRLVGSCKVDSFFFLQFVCTLAKSCLGLVWWLKERKRFTTNGYSMRKCCR